jgi:hypothetical protein
MSKLIRSVGAAAALLVLSATAPIAYADGRNWTDGPIINVSAIRTVDGHFDDYMKWLATSWKKQEEAAKKAGLISSYRVYVVEARAPTDPDLYLVVEYKNWAALDNLGGKLDGISAGVEGSLDKAQQSQVDRAKIRTILGSQTMQAAELK